MTRAEERAWRALRAAWRLYEANPSYANLCRLERAEARYAAACRVPR